MPKTYVFADSVLCLGSISDQPVEAWKNKIKWYLENRYLKDLNRTGGVPMELIRNILRIHYIGHPRRDSKNYD